MLCIVRTGTLPKIFLKKAGMPYALSIFKMCVNSCLKIDFKELSKLFKTESTAGLETRSSIRLNGAVLAFPYPYCQPK